MRQFMHFSSSLPASEQQEPGSPVNDLLISTARYLIIITGLFFAFSALVISGSATTSLMSRLFGLIIAFGLVSVLAYRLLFRSYLLAQLLWQAGLLALIVSAVLILNLPEVLLMTAVLPMIAVITLGWTAGITAELLLIVLARWMTSYPDAIALPQMYVLMILIFGAFGGLLGWTATSHLLTLAHWSLFSFNQARKNLEEAREQRMELKQTQEDLFKANQELARLADRLKVLQRVAEEARQAKAEFVANVSHELRTPLNMIIGFTEVISKTPRTYGSRLPAALMTDITAIQRNSQHLLNLVNDVLDLSQVEAGRMALSREWADLAEVVHESMEVVRDLFQSKGLYLEVEPCEAELPQVFCDRVRIRQVVINLLSNAGRFTQQGGVRIAIMVNKDELITKVTDTGTGISLDDQRKIFEPFQQVDGSIRRQYGGSGLGLTISKQFVEMHGGKMWLESEPGVGTSFFFSLPVYAAVEDDAEALAGFRRSLIPGDERGYKLRSRPNRAPAPVLTPRLIVMEKEQSLQRLLNRYLQDTEVIPVNSLQEAVDQLNRSPAQALIVNAAPFEEPPPEAYTNIPYGTPVISCWIPAEVAAAKKLDVLQYLVKPVPRETLLKTIDKLLHDDPTPGAEQIEGTPDRKPKIVLIADDEPDELHLFARMLESSEQDYQVVQVTNGKRALSMLKSRQPDVLLLDLMMPVMDGFQVLEEKQKDETIRDIPVIVISSRDPAGDMIISNTLKVIHTSGYSARNLLEFIQAAESILTPRSGSG